MPVPLEMQSRLRSDSDLLAKMVLHRGFHRLSDDDATRPLENSRQAYLDAAALGAPFAECDVWSTKDGEIVLSHNATFECMAQDDQSPVALTSISELSWGTLESLPLKDGSTPVLLSTVLQDFSGSTTKLAIELKSSGPAEPLAHFLAANSHLESSVGWVMSFSLEALEAFAAAGAPIGIRMLWIVANPSVPYTAANTEHGLTTFDYVSESLAMFLSRRSLVDRIRSLQCGLYVQYNPSMTPSHVFSIRSDLRSIRGLTSEKSWLADGTCMVGVWTDRSLDPDFDNVWELRKWLGAVDAVNTDLPDTFWSDASDGTASTRDTDSEDENSQSSSAARRDNEEALH